VAQKQRPDQGSGLSISRRYCGAGDNIMAISVFDLFKVGIGPSSSHTVGPMRAARAFVRRLEKDGLLPQVASVRAELFGSLGATGKGHGSDVAVMLGFAGESPRLVDTDAVPGMIAAIRSSKRLRLLGKQAIDFIEAEHLLLHKHDFHGLRCARRRAVKAGLLLGWWRLCGR
jgi:hypothetical protein